MSRNVSILSVVAAVMLFSVLAVVTVAFAEQEEGRGLGQDKVTLCHNGHLIRVGKPAQDAHLNHRDTLDLEACGDQPAAPSTPGTTDTTGTTTGTTGTTGTCTTGTTDTTTDTTTGTTDTRGTNTTGTADISGTTTTGGTTFARDLKNGFGEVPISTGPPLRTRCAALPTLTSGRGKDRMIGGAGKDYIDGVDSKAANDTLKGGLGTDHCAADEGDAFKGCEGHVVKVGVPSATSSPKEAGHQE